MPFRIIFIADDSIGARSFSREIYFSSRDARKTKSKRGVSTIPACSPRANFPEYPPRFELSFSDRARASAVSYFTIPNCGRKSRKRGRARCIARERETLVSHVSTIPFSFFPPFPSFSSFLFYLSARLAHTDGQFSPFFRFF